MELIADTIEELGWIAKCCSSAKYIKYIPKKHKLDPNTFQVMISFSYMLEVSERDYTLWALRYSDKEETFEFFYEEDLSGIQDIVDKIRKSIDDNKTVYNYFF